MRRIPYDEIPLLPNLIAEVVCSRHGVPPDQTAEFAAICDEKCRRCYDAGVDWMVKLARAKSNRGRDQLYVFIAHWLMAYLKNPESFRARHAA